MSRDYRSYTLYPVLCAAIDNRVPAQEIPASAAMMIYLLAKELQAAASLGDCRAEVLARLQWIITRLGKIHWEPHEWVARTAFFPATSLVEEACFLRCLQKCEVAFFAVARGADAIVTGSRRDLDLVLQEICAFLEAAEYAVRLVMERVTPQGFREFTQATGNISALASLNFASVEAHLSSLTPERESSALFSRHPEVLDKVRRGATLVAVVSDKTMLTPAQERLSKWKKLHLAAMIKTVGAAGVDRDAVAYLRQFTAVSASESV